MHRKKVLALGLFIGVLLVSTGGVVTAAEISGSAQSTSSTSNVPGIKIEQLKDQPAIRDFVIGPGKTEVALDPGQSIVKNISIVNRFGQDQEFKISTEDLKGSRNMGESIVLLGNDKGPYSLRDYLKPAITTIKLKHGEKAIVPLLISIPKDASPGGLYGAVIVQTDAEEMKPGADKELVGTGMKITTRLAALYFVRVNGPVKEDGSLIDFYSDKKFYQKGDINLKVVYENRGNVHLNPTGYVRVTNMLGADIDGVGLEPYYVMPDSIRDRDVRISRAFMLGRYKATVTLNRGYGDLSDEKTVVFWVLPWKIMAGIILAIFVIIAVMLGLKKWHSKNFERKPRK